MSGPLTDIKIIELAGIGPGPYAGQLLADMGAEVICVERPGPGLMPGDGAKTVDRRGKKSIAIDLRKPDGVALVLKMVETADVLFEGNRPGVTERLGVGPEDCHKINPKLVYARMTGWGQTGPWANMAGHDINYIGITGALEAIGKEGNPPLPPLNFLGDYGGGTMNLVSGILAALLRAERTGQGDVVDAAIIDGVSSMMGVIYSLDSLGLWQTKRRSNLLDGAMPFYRCYKTRDERFMAIGCIEPKFFALMLEKLNIDPKEFGHQLSPQAWPEQHKKLEEIFASKTRDEWAAVFDGSDACVTPVLDYKEALVHKQNIARGGLKTDDKLVHPRTIPAFDSREAEPEFHISAKGENTEEILLEIGLTKDEIDALRTDTIIK